MDALEKEDGMVDWILGIIRKERVRMLEGELRWPSENELRDLERTMRAYNRIWALEDQDEGVLVDANLTSVSGFTDSGKSGTSKLSDLSNSRPGLPRNATFSLADSSRSSSEIDDRESLLCAM